MTKVNEMLLPLSPMDAVMHNYGFMVLYIFPPSASSPYDLNKLKSSFLSLVQEDYSILIGELFIDPTTGIVNVKQTKESREKGANGIRFEMNETNSMTTEEAIEKRSWDLMPTTRGKTELICVKGSFLSDGGMAIGINVSHALFDGESLFTFMTVWGQHYSGVDKKDRLVVNHERQLLGGTGAPSKMPHPEFRLVEAPEEAAGGRSSASLSTEHYLFHFTPEMMKRIKEVATKGGSTGDSGPSYVSTVDAITALFTVLISRARGHGQDVQITTGVNARRRLSPPLPTNYVGNVIFYALSTYSHSELQPQDEDDDFVSPATLRKLATRVRESILRCGDAYSRDVINFLTEQTTTSPIDVSTNFVFGPDLMFSSWVHLGMYNAEFGGTKPWYACSPCLPCYDGFVMITEAQKYRDGVDVGVCLETSAMEKLKTMFGNVVYLHE